MSKSRKIFWSIISLIAFILLLPVLIVVGILITSGVYIQVMKDVLNKEFEEDEEDAVGDPEYVDALPEDCEQNY